MNYTITDNPYREGVTILSSGVGVSCKVAKLNDDKKSYEVTKRDRLVKNWESGRPHEDIHAISATQASPSQDYNGLLKKIGISAVENPTLSTSTGAKKLRVNKIVQDKASTIYNNSEHIAAPVQKPAETSIVQETVSTMSPIVETPTVDEMRGRHERAEEVSVQGVQDTQADNSVGTRLERNAITAEMINRENIKAEPKGGDVDLYNSLLHNDGDVSKQLQGARLELEEVKSEGRKLAAQYSQAVEELEKLKKDIEYQSRMRQEQEKNELSSTLKDIAAIKQANLAKTSDLSSIQAEIARLKTERENMMASDYDAHSMGRAA